MEQMRDFSRIHYEPAPEPKAKTVRNDGQVCPVEENIDKDTGEVKHKVKSPGFYAFNKINYQAKVNLSMKYPSANSILDYFISEMDNTNAICISMATLEKVFNKSRQSLSKHIAILEKLKFIQIYKIGNMNAYAVNAYLVFTKGEHNLWQAKFTATMILDFEEQTPEVQAVWTKTVAEKENKKKKGGK